MVRTAPDWTVSNDAPSSTDAASSEPTSPVIAPDASGPSATAAWTQREVTAATGLSLLVGFLPDASNGRRQAAGAAGVHHALLRRPTLWRDGSGVPTFSLTLILSRAPGPDDSNIAALVESGVLAFDVRLSAPPTVQREAGDAAGVGECRSIFARSSKLDLLWTEAGGEQSMSLANPTGIVMRAGLNTRLARAQALDVLAALTGQASSFRVRGYVEFRATHPDTERLLNRTAEFDSRLDEIIGGALVGEPPDRHIHLISPAATPGGGSGPAPTRVRSGPATRGATNSGERMTATGGRLQAMTVAMQPAATVASPTAIVASDLVHANAVATAGRPQYFIVDNALVELATTTQPRSLPIVDDPHAPVWRDRNTATKYWYASALEVVMPDPRGDAQSSPFTFTFTRTGATTAGAALSGTVRLTLQRTMSAPTREAIARLGNVQVQEVVPLAISAALIIPYVGADDGRQKTTAVRGIVSSAAGNRWTVSFDLLNEWVRLCYGSLSQPGFQAQPARIEVSWSFDAYVTVKPQKFNVVSGAKAARPPAVSMTHAVLATHTNVAITPQLAATPAILDTIRRTTYATKTIVRQDRSEALLPCERFGAFYLETSSTGTAAVGCVDALRLGQATLRQYAEMAELATARYRVFRSLQQPGRFLLIPASYQITRYGASVPDKAFRPAVAVYSALDAANPANNRVVYHATLQPDVQPHERRTLRAVLSAHSANPQIEYPTEIAAECSYVWMLGGGANIEARALKMPDAFQVTLSTDIAGALLVQTMLQTAGVSGSVTFQLPDGTRLQSLLGIDLRTVVGPWETGPVTISTNGGRARLTNRIERPVEVADLLVFPPLEGNELTVERLLPPGGTHEVALPGGAEEVFPIATVPAVGPVVLEEIRTFVEDIYTSIVFLDLINHTVHNLRDLQIEARLKNVPGLKTLRPAGDPPSATAEFILPLTTYLANRTLQFRVTKTFTESPPLVSPWLDWDLDRNGNVVSLTWELVG